MLFLIIIELAFSQSINLIEQNQSSWIIYSNGEQNPLFLWPHEQCCTPPDLAIITATNLTNFKNTVIITFIDFTLISHKGNTDYKGYNTIITWNVQGRYLNVTNICKQNKESQKEELNESGLIYLELKVQNVFTNQQLDLIFHYWFYCEYSPDINRQKTNYDLSQQLVIILGCLVVWIFAQSYKIKSINIPIPSQYSFVKYIFAVQPFIKEKQNVFQGFRVTWITVIFYVIGAGVFYTIIFTDDNWHHLILIFIMIFSFFTSWFFMNEVLYYLPANFNCQKKICMCIKVCDIVSLIWASLIVALYLILHQPWYLSTIIAFCIQGALARAFKILNFKDVTIFYALVIIYDLILYSAFLKKKDINYQTEMLMYSNYPVLYEIPQMKSQLYKLCVWLSVSDLFMPCLSVGYLYRFGKNRNSKAYFYIGLTGMFLGIILWSLVAFSVGTKGDQVAQSYIVLPIIVISVIIWSVRQGDFKELWYGYFYDKYLMPQLNQEFTEDEINNLQNNLQKQTDELLKELELNINQNNPKVYDFYQPQ